MLRRSNEFFIEDRVLTEIHGGSFEETLSKLSELIEQSEKFGGPSVLFATFPDRAVVMNEHGIFFSVSYELSQGRLVLTDIEEMDVETVSEEDLASKGVDIYFEEGTLLKGLRNLVLGTSRTGSTLEEVRVKLQGLFDGSRQWEKTLEERRDVIGKFAWDPEYGSLDIDVAPKFGRILKSDWDEESDGKHRDMIVSSLRELHDRLTLRLSSVSEAFEKYKAGTEFEQGEEGMLTLGALDGFAGDYVEHLSLVDDVVAEALREVDEGGCALCAAMVHDEIAKKYIDLDLGGRFIRKVVAQFNM